MTPLVTAWSYSRWADYEQCPLRFKFKHIDRLFDPGGPAMERGTVIHKMAENHVAAPATRAGRAVPPELRHFAKQFAELRELKPLVEQNWGFKNDWSWIGRSGWFGDDVWFRAKADVATVYEDHTADVIDHKTGRKYGSNEEQVGLMALAVFKRFAGVQHVTARLWYLDIDPAKEENELIFEYTAKDAAAIQKDWTKRVVPMFLDRKFPPRPNDKCHWCAFSRNSGGPCKF